MYLGYAWNVECENRWSYTQHMKFVIVGNENQRRATMMMMMMLHFITMNSRIKTLQSHTLNTIQIIKWLPITFDSIEICVFNDAKTKICYVDFIVTHTHNVSSSLCWCHMKSICFWTEFDCQSELSTVFCTFVWVCMVQICQIAGKLLQA